MCQRQTPSGGWSTRIVCAHSVGVAAGVDGVRLQPRPKKNRRMRAVSAGGYSGNPEPTPCIFPCPAAACCRWPCPSRPPPWPPASRPASSPSRRQTCAQPYPASIPAQPASSSTRPTSRATPSPTSPMPATAGAAFPSLPSPSRRQSGPSPETTPPTCRRPSTGSLLCRSMRADSAAPCCCAWATTAWPLQSPSRPAA